LEDVRVLLVAAELFEPELLFEFLFVLLFLFELPLELVLLLELVFLLVLMFEFLFEDAVLFSYEAVTFPYLFPIFYADKPDF
jgi:hypothetical protein